MRNGLLGMALVLLLGLGACSESDEASLPKPREPNSASIAYFCHMALTEHEGPKAQLFLRGQAEPVWFASASEAFMFLATELAQPRDLQAVYVNDMSQGTWEVPAAGAWVEAEKAFYVVGSSRTSAMGEKEAVPFSTKEAAEAFATQYGGSVSDFAAAKAALAADFTANGS